MNRTILPVGIDDPPPIFLWTQHQIIVFMIGMFGGFYIGGYAMFVGMGIGAIGAHLMRRYQASFPDGYLVHRLYRIGLVLPKGRGAINPFQTRIEP